MCLQRYSMAINAVFQDSRVTKIIIPSTQATRNTFQGANCLRNPQENANPPKLLKSNKLHSGNVTKTMPVPVSRRCKDTGRMSDKVISAVHSQMMWHFYSIFSWLYVAMLSIDVVLFTLLNRRGHLWYGRLRLLRMMDLYIWYPYSSEIRLMVIFIFLDIL